MDIQTKNDYFFFLRIQSINILPRKFRSIQRFTEINLAGDIRYKMSPPLESGTITRHYTNQTVIFMSQKVRGLRYNCISRTSRTTSRPSPPKPFAVSIPAG